MKEQHLLATQTCRLKASRVPMRPKIKTDRPNHVWGIDMTKVLIPTWGWVYVVIVLDWGSRKIVGYDISVQSKTGDWLRALDRALNVQFPAGVRERALNLVSDNGCQPTSERFMKHCGVLAIRQIFTSYCNPKGNANTERVIRTLKEDLIWPREWYSLSQLETSLPRWIQQYNEDFPHSMLRNKTPAQYEAEYQETENANMEAATLSI
jgi:transposase InsO family protein